MNNLKVLKCSKPKGYTPTNLYFTSVKSAEDYTKKITDNFLLKKAEMMEHPSLSKRKRKIIKFAQSTKYVLTKKGAEYLLWEKI